MNSKDNPAPELVLASSSPYRRELLQRLNLEFATHAPDIDETPAQGESARQTSLRLAQTKAQTVLQHYPQSLVIASDQVCLVNGQQLGKPGTQERAIEQLRLLSGHSAHFHTAVCVARGADIWHGEDCTEVQFRQLDDASICRYLEQEPALNCAGSFMSEGLGISLCEAIISRDPSALIGLPLIITAKLLRGAGLHLP